MKSYLLSLTFFLSLLSIYSIEVGFFSENLGGKSIGLSDYSDIAKAISLAGGAEKKSVLLSSDLTTATSALNNLDVIVITLQEAAKNQAETLIKDKIKLRLGLPEADYDCDVQYKRGHTKIKALYEIVSVICHKKQLFAVVQQKTQNKLIQEITQYVAKLKGSVGECLRLKTNEKIYCFYSSHIDTNQIEGAQRAASLYKKISDRTAPVDRNYLQLYMMGDWNTRLVITPIDTKEPKTATKASIDQCQQCLQAKLANLPTCLNGLNIEVNIAEADETSCAINTAAYIASPKRGSSLLHFLGNDNLHALPFTYKYKENVPTEPIDITKYDIDNIAKTKNAGNGLHLNNYGWLDRLAKISVSEAETETVHYSACPSLRKADHMPIVAHVSIKVNPKGASKPGILKKKYH